MPIPDSGHENKRAAYPKVTYARVGGNILRFDAYEPHISLHLHVLKGVRKRPQHGTKNAPCQTARVVIHTARECCRYTQHYFKAGQSINFFIRYGLRFCGQTKHSDELKKSRGALLQRLLYVHIMCGCERVCVTKQNKPRNTYASKKADCSKKMAARSTRCMLCCKCIQAAQKGNEPLLQHYYILMLRRLRSSARESSWRP